MQQGSSPVAHVAKESCSVTPAIKPSPVHAILRVGSSRT